jgi:hypothetical protein
MRGLLKMSLLACALLATPGLTAQPDEVLETILVTGEQPGPGLWKVSKGDSVMWVFATFGQLPKGMAWRSQQVEARIAESQEVLLGGNIRIRPNFGMFRAITLLPAALKEGRNPGGATLQQVLPPDTYARWRVLREKYVGNGDDIEKLRPVHAFSELRGKAMHKHGLQEGLGVSGYVLGAAKKHKVRIHRLKDVERVVRVDPDDMVNAARKEGAPDLECFTRDLRELEPGLERAKARANAWARGDIAKLRELQQPRWKIQDDCGYIRVGIGVARLAARTDGASTEAARMKKVLTDAMWHSDWAAVQARQEWLAAAQAALAKNKSTFAVLPIDDVLDVDGPLERLRKLGYTVEEPL